MLGGPNPAEVRAGLDAMVASIENGAAFQWANDAENTAFLAHVVSRTGSYLSSTAGIALGDQWPIWWRRRWKRHSALTRR